MTVAERNQLLEQVARTLESMGRLYGRRCKAASEEDSWNRDFNDGAECAMTEGAELVRSFKISENEL